MKEKYALLKQISLQIIQGEEPVRIVRENRDLINAVDHNQVVWLVDSFWLDQMEIGTLKRGVNKLINLFSKALQDNYPNVDIPGDSFPEFMHRQNEKLVHLMNDIKPINKQLNRTGFNYELRLNLQSGFNKLTRFADYFAAKEGIAFPQIEKYWEDYRCVKLMWSIHDDIRRNLKLMNQLLADPTFDDLSRYNRLSADIFFALGTIRFRDEYILIPHMLEKIPAHVLSDMMNELPEYGFGTVSAKTSKPAGQLSGQNTIDLQSGQLSPELIRLLINTLPLDLSYVDEENKVRYFSEPEHRIFPRSRSVIGRDVRNCHPPESVHVVNRIIDEFRAGEKDKAEFWIDYKGHKILISYFAVRDEKGGYKGVLEVVQDVEQIRKLQGERRLLAWDEADAE